jgi:hypothetical protein
LPWTPKLDVSRKGIHPWPEATRGMTESPMRRESPASTCRDRVEQGEWNIDHPLSGGSDYGVLVFVGGRVKLPIRIRDFKSVSAVGLDRRRTGR